MDSRIERFCRQYLQQVDVDKLSFPSTDVLIEPAIQFQLSEFLFRWPSIFPSGSGGGVYLPLPLPSYRKRVAKALMKRLEEVTFIPDEDEISNQLMEEMASISAIADMSPLEAAQQSTVLTYCLPYGGQEAWNNCILIKESPNVLGSAGGTGRRTWGACLHLATYLATEGRSLITGKSVLELGVGTGLLSIVCAGPLSAAYVLATDGDTEVDKSIQESLKLNSHLSGTSSGKIPLEMRVLEWGSAAVLGRVLQSKGGNILYDTILGADITYSLDSLEPLASTLGGLAELYPRADIVVAATMRNEDTFDLFVAHCLNHSLSVHDIEFDCPQFEQQVGLFHSINPPIRLVRIKREH